MLLEQCSKTDVLQAKYSKNKRGVKWYAKLWYFLLSNYTKLFKELLVKKKKNFVTIQW